MRSKLNLKSVIVAASGVALIYLAGVVMELPMEWILALYGLSMGATIWMVVRILKDPCAIEKTFDDYFYQDRPDLRRSGKE
jgi:hypothetical protein